MAKFLKILSFALVVAMMLSMTAFAAELGTVTSTPDKEHRTVKVEGNVTNAEDNQQVVILVLKSGKSLTSFGDDDIAYVDQIEADGGYEFNFGIDASKGDRFTAYIGGSAVAQPKSFSISLSESGPGDCTGPDGKPDDAVNILDYDLVIGAFGTKEGQPGYDPRADIDEKMDKMININDYDLKNWRLMHIGAQPVPPSLIKRWQKKFR